MVNYGLCITPTANLISNIGFGVEATHTTYNSIYANLEARGLQLPLIHPAYVVRDMVYDGNYNATYLPPLVDGRLLNLSNLPKIIKSNIARFLSKL
jgi:hypothetical protein